MLYIQTSWRLIQSSLWKSSDFHWMSEKNLQHTEHTEQQWSTISFLWLHRMKAGGRTKARKLILQPFSPRNCLSRNPDLYAKWIVQICFPWLARGKVDGRRKASRYFFNPFLRKTALAETLMLMQCGLGCKTETRGRPKARRRQKVVTALFPSHTQKKTWCTSWRLEVLVSGRK